MADKYLVREQGKDGGTLCDNETDARIKAQQWTQQTGVITCVYECDLLTIFQADKELPLRAVTSQSGRDYVRNHLTDPRDTTDNHTGTDEFPFRAI